MRIGLGGSIGPLRGGISTRGVGLGVGPVRATSGYGRGNGILGQLIGLSLLICLVFLVVAWPYLLGTWLAVTAGAGRHSSGRAAVGWIFEVVVVAIEIGVLIRARAAGADRRRHAAEEAARLDAERRVESLETQRENLASLVAAVRTSSTGRDDAVLPAAERVLAEYDDVSLIEPRSAYRSGPLVDTDIDHGGAVVTTRAVHFHGKAKNVEWRFDRMQNDAVENGVYRFSVANRRLVAGIQPEAEALPAVIGAVEWAKQIAAGGDIDDFIVELEAVIGELDAEIDVLTGELLERYRSPGPLPTAD
jgi:hypothetical protein